MTRKRKKARRSRKAAGDDGSYLAHEIARGGARPTAAARDEDGNLRPGVVVEIVDDGQGKKKAIRRRFSLVRGS